MADSNQTIIIKKIKKGGHGHHGGAWKVAYADFVTAMMAFFLLLWLLASTSEDTKKGLADYFTPTIGLKDAMGIGVEGGQSPVKDGISKSDLMPPGVIVGQVPQGPINDVPKDSMVDGEADAKLFEKAEEALKQAMDADPNLRELSDNIVMEQTPEGLKLAMKDSDKHPMFLPHSVNLTDDGQKMLAVVTTLIRKMPNLISLTGHTDANPPGKSDYTNWELSADRANSARRFLVTHGLSEKQIGKVVGRADQEPLLPETPNASQNRRIEIILLKGTHMNQRLQQQVAPRPLLNAPRVQDTLKVMQKNIEKKEGPKPISGEAKETGSKPLGEVPTLPGVIPLKPVLGSTSSGGGNFVIPDAPSLLPARKPAAPKP